MIHLPQETIESILSRIDDVAHSGYLTEGGATLQLENALAHHHGSDYSATSFNSCGSGLFALLKILHKSRPRNIALIQENTMYGIAMLSHTAGFEVHTVSCKDLVMDPRGLSIALNQLMRQPSEFNPVVIYSHIGGSLGHSINEIAEICDRFKVPLIEDSAHTLGAQDKVHGLAAVYSMYATNALPAGEGGILVTKDDKVDSLLRRFKTYDREKMEMVMGLNLRCSDLQAATMLAVWKHRKRIIESRIRKVNLYKTVCDELGIEYLNTDYENHNGYKFIVTDRRAVKEAQCELSWREDNIFTGNVYPYRMTDGLPVIRDVFDHVCLNTHYSVPEETLETAVDFLKSLGGD